MYLKPIWVGAKIVRQSKLDFHQLLSSISRSTMLIFPILKKWSSLMFILFATMLHFKIGKKRSQLVKKRYDNHNPIARLATW